MDFELSEEEALIRETARDFAARELAPRAYEIDRREEIPRDVIRGLGALGLLGVRAPDELGGAGASTVAYSVAMSEIAAGCASTAVAMAALTLGPGPHTLDWPVLLSPGAACTDVAVRATAGHRPVAAMTARRSARWSS